MNQKKRKKNELENRQKLGKKKKILKIDNGFIKAKHHRHCVEM